MPGTRRSAMGQPGLPNDLHSPLLDGRAGVWRGSKRAAGQACGKRIGGIPHGNRTDGSAPTEVPDEHSMRRVGRTLLLSSRTRPDEPRVARAGGGATSRVGCAPDSLARAGIGSAPPARGNVERGSLPLAARYADATASSRSSKSGMSGYLGCARSNIRLNSSHDRHAFMRPITA